MVALPAHTGLGGPADQWDVVHVRRGNLDGVAAEFLQQLDLVLEADGGEEGQAEAVAVLLELAPLVLGQGAAAKDLVK